VTFSTDFECLTVRAESDSRPEFHDGMTAEVKQRFCRLLESIGERLETLALDGLHVVLLELAVESSLADAKHACGGQLVAAGLT